MTESPKGAIVLVSVCRVGRAFRDRLNKKNGFNVFSWFFVYARVRALGLSFRGFL